SGHPGQVAVLVAAELCSLTIQRDDTSVANLIASGLFGDGAAAVVAVGADHPSAGHGPSAITSRSRLYPDTEGVMGWDVGSQGLKIVLGAEVPTLVRDHVAADIDRFLADHGLDRTDVAWWVCHPGGPKVLRAFADALDVPHDALAVTWESRRSVGNLS